MSSLAGEPAELREYEIDRTRPLNDALMSFWLC